MSKVTPRSKFLQQFEDKKLAAVVWDLMKLATTHDPDHAKDIRRLDRWTNRLFGRVIALENRP